MPSGYMHQRLAMEAMVQAGLMGGDIPAFVFGAQGPDPFFLKNFTPLSLNAKPGPLSRTVHTTHTGAFLQELLTLAMKKGATERSYALGFVTHYALDSTAHPTVYRRSVDNKGDYKSSLHMQLEANWDTEAFQRDHGRGTSVRMPGVKEARKQWRAIAALAAEAVTAIYPDLAITADEITVVYRDNVRINRLTHSPWGVKYRLVCFVERLAGIRGRLSCFIAPPRVPMPDPELWVLYDQALSLATGYLVAARRYLDGQSTAAELSAVLGNRSYLTGMELGT